MPVDLTVKFYGGRGGTKTRLPTGGGVCGKGGTAGSRRDPDGKIPFERP